MKSRYLSRRLICNKELQPVGPTPTGKGIRVGCYVRWGTDIERTRGADSWSTSSHHLVGWEGARAGPWGGLVPASFSWAHCQPSLRFRNKTPWRGLESFTYQSVRIITSTRQEFSPMIEKVISMWLRDTGGRCWLVFSFMSHPAVQNIWPSWTLWETSWKRCSSETLVVVLGNQRLFGRWSLNLEGHDREKWLTQSEPQHCFVIGLQCSSWIIHFIWT